MKDRLLNNFHPQNSWSTVKNNSIVLAKISYKYYIICISKGTSTVDTVWLYTVI